MTQHRTRREVLAASPAVALAALGGASALAFASARDLFDVQDRIIATPARTLAGLQIKVRMVAQDHDNNTHGTDLVSIERMLGDPDITEGRAGLSFAADILRLTRTIA